ncbi:MAG: MOSC domain-containing protein [Candidatus Binataceae bacterium]
MKERHLGVIRSMYRYPVKSMLGEQVGELAIGTGGGIGDRAWALRELATGRIVSGKKWGAMFNFSASYPSKPDETASAPPRITIPGGQIVNAGDPDASAMISEALGHKVKLERAEAGKSARAILDRDTAFGDMRAEDVFAMYEQAFPGITGYDDWLMPQGTFFDAAPLHLLTAATLNRLAELCGGDSRFDVRRFRPNLFIDTDGANGFPEDEWIGATIRVGQSVRIAIALPVFRCVMTTLAQTDLPHDPAILRTVAKHHAANAGVYAAVISPGVVRAGDSVSMVI